MIYRTRGEHANHYTTRGEHANHYTTRGEHANHYTTDVVYSCMYKISLTFFMLKITCFKWELNQLISSTFDHPFVLIVL
jgi:hypothetical protein